MPDTAQSLSTPDPLLTTEALGSTAGAFVADLYILFGSNMPNEKQTALAAIVTTAWAVFVLIHGAVVRKGRAAGGGLVGTIINEIPVAGSDAGDGAPLIP